MKNYPNIRRANSVILVFLLALFAVTAFTGCKPASQSEKRGGEFLCAVGKIRGVAAAQFANRSDCDAGETDLLSRALADAFDKCEKFCAPTGCADSPPTGDAIRATASVCRGPGLENKFYRDATTNEFDCRCIMAVAPS